jgi:hypothetical protein
MTDGVDQLSNMSGLSRDGIKNIWKEVQANHAKLASCPRHRFEGGSVKIGQKVTCLNCGGMTGLVHVGDYIDGYRAAGGDVNDIWPEYDGKKA